MGLDDINGEITKIRNLVILGDREAFDEYYAKKFEKPIDQYLLDKLFGKRKLVRARLDR